MIQPLWKMVWRFLKKLGIKPPYYPTISLLSIYPEETKTEKMLNTAHYQRNANQNYNELSPHTSQNGHHRKSTNNKCWTGVEKRECSCTVGGNVN